MIILFLIETIIRTILPPDFDFPPPPAFAGPLGGVASMTCQVAFPETDAMELSDPTITWFQVK